MKAEPMHASTGTEESALVAPSARAGGPSRSGITPVRALVVIPGTLFWVLIITGASTGNSTLIGIGVALFFVTAVVAISAKVKVSAAQRAERRRLWTTGEVAEARVVSIGTRGGGYNGHPRVELTLDVTMPQRQPYRTSASAMVCKLALPRVQPGCVIEIRVDSNDRDKLVIDETLTPNGHA